MSSDHTCSSEFLISAAKLRTYICKQIGSELYNGIANLDMRTESLSYKRNHLQWLKREISPPPTNQTTNKINYEFETTTIRSYINNHTDPHDKQVNYSDQGLFVLCSVYAPKSDVTLKYAATLPSEFLLHYHS